MLNTGKRIHGFEIVRSREVSELNGVLYEMTHEKTGAKLCWLDNGQANKLFGIAFTTLPTDDTGVFHILEHSVLCGSEKYPVKEPFVELLKSSLNTFLNALTYPDRTVYPVSSRNPQDFLNLVSVYLDAVFAPCFLENRSIFLQEGWRIDEEEGKPCYKGVVYNEMKGALSDELGLISRKFRKLIFPDTAYGFNSGGSPEAIRRLSYEQFIKTYRDAYHPSNAYVYLDGSVPLEETLSLLDKYFSRYNKKESLPIFTLQRPTAAEKTDFYEVKEGAPTEDKASLTFGKIICDWTSRYRAQAVRVLGDALTGNNESPLKKALLDSGLAMNITVSCQTSGLQPYVTVYIKDVKDGAAGQVMELLREEAERLLASGLDRATLHAVINRMEFQFREPEEPQGLYRCTEILNGWQYGGDPLDSLVYDPLFASLRSMVDAGEYEALLREIFVNADGRVVLHMEPSASLGEELRTAEALELQAICGDWSEEERERKRLGNVRLQQWQQTPDAPEAIASIPVLRLDEIDCSVEWMDTVEERIDGMTVLYHSAPTQSIVYANAFFSLTDYTLDELTRLALLPKLLGKLPTRTHSALELERLLKTYTGTMEFSILPMSIGDDVQTSLPCLMVRFSALRENLDKAVELMVDILKNTLWDRERVGLIIRQLDVNLSRIGILGGHIIGMFSVTAPYSATAAVTEATGGGTYYRWMHGFAADFDAQFDSFAALAQRMQRETICRNRLTLGVTAQQPCRLDRLKELLPLGSKVPATAAYSLSMPARIGMRIPAQINYAAQGYHLSEAGMKFHGSMKVAEKILSLNYFWNEIRAKGGAYGAGYAIGPGGGMYTYTYRDPSPAASLAANAGAAAYLEDFCAGDEPLERYIISTVAEDDPLRSPASNGQIADVNWLTRFTKEQAVRIRDEMLHTTREDLLALIDVLTAFASKGTVCVVGHQGAIDECGDMTPLEI